MLSVAELVTGASILGGKRHIIEISGEEGNHLKFCIMQCKTAQQTLKTEVQDFIFPQCDTRIYLKFKHYRYNLLSKARFIEVLIFMSKML